MDQRREDDNERKDATLHPLHLKKEGLAELAKVGG